MAIKNKSLLNIITFSLSCLFLAAMHQDLKAATTESYKTSLTPSEKNNLLSNIELISIILNEIGLHFRNTEIINYREYNKPNITKRDIHSLVSDLQYTIALDKNNLSSEQTNSNQSLTITIPTQQGPIQKEQSIKAWLHDCDLILDKIKSLESILHYPSLNQNQKNILINNIKQLISIINNEPIKDCGNMSILSSSILLNSILPFIESRNRILRSDIEDIHEIIAGLIRTIENKTRGNLALKAKNSLSQLKDIMQKITQLQSEI